MNAQRVHRPSVRRIQAPRPNVPMRLLATSLVARRSLDRRMIRPPAL